MLACCVIGGATLSEAVDVPPGAFPQRSVLLGDPSLTAGVPGAGPLTAEQAKAWLADPDRHRPLRPRLPRGLAAGAAGVSGVADNPLTLAKIELGRQLYFDTRLSGDGTVSCASCHSPEHGYATDTAVGVGIGGQLGARNAPPAYNRILSSAQFWDGRASSLEEQAIAPIANPAEMGGTHRGCVETLRRIDAYRVQFNSVFDDGVTIQNVGRAIAAFERVVVTGPSAWDHHERLTRFEKAYAGDLTDLPALQREEPELVLEYVELLSAAHRRPTSRAARRGAELFFSQRVGCAQCHAGANFTDERYHNLGVGYDRDEGAQPDPGRFAVTGRERDRGAFKTPTLRGVAHTAPYMHDGSLETLGEVIDWYDAGGWENPQLSGKIRPIGLTDAERADLIAFLEALTGELPAVETGRLPE